MRRVPPLAVFAVAAAAAVGAGVMLRRTTPPRPSLAALGPSPYPLQDLALAAAGSRAAAADLAWVQLLQYGAGSAPPGWEDEPGKPYARLKDMSLRVIRLDPSLGRAALFGGGLLGWFHGVERPAEAAEVLHAAMRLNPSDPLPSLYLAALAYKQKGRAGEMIALLETSFDDPRTPTQMKAILANLRKARGERAQAMSLWERILANPADASEHARARAQIAELSGRQ
jgi:hypothetical protein